MNVSFRELKKHLCELLNWVAVRERITATIRAVPAEHGRDNPLGRLERAHWIVRPTRSKRTLGIDQGPRIRRNETTLSEIVREDRG